MKKISLVLVLLFFYLAGTAQTYWTKTPEDVQENENALLGNINKRSLNFVTDNEVRVIADSLGRFRIKGLAGKGYRLLYVDSLGNISARGGGGLIETEETAWNLCNNEAPVAYETNHNDLFKCPSAPCVLGAGPWYEGGNRIGNSGNSSVGTCSNHDFILKSNGTDRIWIKTSGKIGMGTSSPLTNLEIQDASNVEVLANNTSANPTSVWVMNTANNYALHIDNGGIGHISQNRGSLHHLLGFKYNSSNTVPEQVWVGTRPTTGTHADFNFCVGGKLVSKSLYVSVAGSWADYVFSKDYKLKPLSEVDEYISKYGHLPNVPSEKEIIDKEYGLNISEMQKIQMEKIEELFLYTIQLQKEVEELKAENKELLKSIKK